MTDTETLIKECLTDHAAEAELADLVGPAKVRGRQLSRRRSAIAAATAVPVIAAVAVPLAVDNHGGGRSAQTVAVATSASPSTSASSASPTDFGFDPTGPAPTCPKGELPAVSADLGIADGGGTYVASDGHSWIGPYIKSLGPVYQSAGFTLSSINGNAPNAATPSVWVLGGTKDGFTSSVLLVQTSDSTWEAHPATFTGCQTPAQ
jgi:hypothetical protein